jgi:hypothetical protein
MRPSPPAPEATFVKIPDLKPRAYRRPVKSASNNSDSVEGRLHRIALAMHQYYSVHRSFPVKPDRKLLDDAGRPYLSWRVHLLPFLDEAPLYAQFKLDEPWDSPHNIELLRHMPDVYRSSPRDKAETRFATPIADYAVFGRERPMMLQQISDGTSNTIMVVQTAASRTIPWTKPEDFAVELDHPRRAWGPAPKGILCAMADGSMLQLPGTVPDGILSALITGRGREVIDIGTVRRYSAYQRGEMLISPEQAHDHEQHKIKQIGLALMNFESAQRQFPGAGPLTEQPPGRGMQLSWRVHVLPYLEHGNLYSQFHLDEPWDSPHNKPLAAYMPDLYRDADDPLDSITTRIMVITGPGTPFADRKRGPRMRDFRDGASKTILALQAGDESAVIWTKPDDLAFDPSHPLAGLTRTNPRVGLLAVMADGAVRTLSPDIDGESFRKLVTPNGGEIIDAQ